MTSRLFSYTFVVFPRLTPKMITSDVSVTSMGISIPCEQLDLIKESCFVLRGSKAELMKASVSSVCLAIESETWQLKFDSFSCLSLLLP